jgi:hypothetical protein
MVSLSPKKYDTGCSSRIPDPDAVFLPSRIPDPGVKKAPNPGSRIRIRNTEAQDPSQNVTDLEHCFRRSKKFNQHLRCCTVCAPRVLKMFYLAFCFFDITSNLNKILYDVGQNTALQNINAPGGSEGVSKVMFNFPQTFSGQNRHVYCI